MDETIGRQFEKLPPHSIEAEACLIGSLLICANDRLLFTSVLSIVDREAFYLADHQVYFDCLVEMFRSNRAIDALTVRESLMRKHIFEEVGATEYLAKLLNTVPSYAHAEHYAQIVAGKSKLRQAIAMSNDLLRDCYAPTDARDDIDHANGLLSGAITTAGKILMTGRTDKIYTINDVLPEVLGARNAKNVTKHPTKLRGLNRLIFGLGFGEKTIIGGKQSMGKSAFIKHLINGMLEDGIPVGYINIEETRQKIVANILSSHSGVPSNRIQNGNAGKDDWEKIESAGESIRNLPLKIVDSARKISSILGMVNVLAVKEGCRGIFVDHLHIIDTEAQKGENREREISRISGDLKWAWKETNVIGVEAAQLNRGSGSERPTMENLRDSGSLAQDADVVVLLHREDYYGRNDPTYQPNYLLELIVAKHKAGATGTVPVKYNDAIYYIEDVEEAPPDTAGMFE